MSTIYVNIPGVAGEATSTSFSDQIECMGIGHGIYSPVRSTNPRYQGASEHGPIVLYHGLDKASPALRQLALSGNRPAGEVTINVVSNVGGNQVVTETITLTDVKVESVQLVTVVDQASGEPGNQLLEAFSLSYSGKIGWDHVSFDDQDPPQQTRVTGAYDVSEGAAPV